MAEERFGFGKNWMRYIEKQCDEGRVSQAQTHLLDFMGCKNLDGHTFLDIGSGSGVHSLAAMRAGAQGVYSFDYDVNSVEATKYLRETKGGSPKEWTVDQGSILDSDYLKRLGSYDIVYSWGVLHHTGDQWTAMRNAAQLVKDDGLLYIALYSADVQKDPPPEFWLEVKKRYLASGPWKRRWMVLWYVWRFEMQRRLRALPSLLMRIYRYRMERGMSFFTDIRDWLGGWPMEFSHDNDVIEMFTKELGFRLERIAQGQANTEYLFRKSPSQ